MRKIKTFTALLLTAVIFVTAFCGCSTDNSTVEGDYKNDFYTAVNKQWLEETKLTQGQAYTGSFTEAENNISEFYSNYIDTLESKDNLSNNEKGLLTLLSQYNTSESEEVKENVKKYTKKIEEVKTLADLEKLYKDERVSIYNKLLSLEAANTRSEYVLRLSPKSITGADISESPALTEQGKENFIKVCLSLFKAAGYSEKEADETLTEALNIEEKIAAIFASEKEKKETLHGVGSEFLFNINLPDILNSLGYEESCQRIMCNDSYADLLNDEILTEDNVESLKAYLKAATVCTIMGAGKESGTQFSTVAKVFTPELLTREYINQNITEDDIGAVEDMVEKIVDVYKERIEDIDYLTDHTKEKAKTKLDKIHCMVAKQNNYIDYSKADISSENDYITNLENCVIEKRSQQGELLKKSFQEENIITNTMEVNAYYAAGYNTVIINAGILQEPFYERGADFEENLGSIGTIIAHEVSHSLDIEGSQYDENGDYKDWWTVDDRKRYVEKVTQLKSFMLEQGEKDGIALNAADTRCEDIADLTAVQCCVDILNGMDSPNYEKFFKDYARQWRTKLADGMLEKYIKYSNHSPNKYRTNVPLMQIEEFYTAFNVNEGDGMYVKPKERISVW